MEIFSWKDIKEDGKLNAAYAETDHFFEQIYHLLKGGSTINSTTFGNLTYREGQHSYALDVMDAIMKKKILLLEAGVGIGKSFGYLIPIFYTYKNVEKFNKIVISTSNIALQQQLLTVIHQISNMLGIEIKADIVKGVTNYACLARLESLINSSYTSDEMKVQLKRIRKQIENLCSSDRADLETISDNVWKSIQLQSRGYCSDCVYSRMCPFYKKEKAIGQSNILVTNHAKLVTEGLRDGALLQNVDMLVFDEAHKLEENIRNTQEEKISLSKVLYAVEQVGYILHQNFQGFAICSVEGVDAGYHNYLDVLKENLEKLFVSIRYNANRNFTNINNKENSIVDCSRLAFSFSDRVQYYLKEVIQGLKTVERSVQKFEETSSIQLNTSEWRLLQQVSKLFQDMALQNNSKNIYWCSFYKKDRIDIYCSPKENLKLRDKIFPKGIPTICTSGTLVDNYDSYNYFCQSVGLTGLEGTEVSYGDRQASPYDYANNTLFYYDPTIANPNCLEDYIVGLTVRIIELIRMTNGKALILFTSKECMKAVYNLLMCEEFPFKILLQDETNINEVRQEFEEDVNSCLLATGAFWEGIDVKGAALSNLIITHLPFDTVDALTRYKASKYATREDQFKEVYIPSMLIKLEQAVGRLVRSHDDKGIVSCLDSRVVNYLSFIQNKLPITNYTTELDDVREFVEEKLLLFTAA